MNHFRNQKGLTTIELFAVIVILGIISAIAVPTIGGIIDNSKKDAHISNAHQILTFSQSLITSKFEYAPDNDHYSLIPVSLLIEEGYLELFKSPDGVEYSIDPTFNKSAHINKKNLNDNRAGSYVLVKKVGSQYLYSVRLDSEEGGRSIPLTDKQDIERGVVQLIRN